MAINPALLNKHAAPAPGGSDPMLEQSFDDGMQDGEQAAEDAPSPLADVSDEDLMAEAVKRGMQVTPAQEEEAAVADDQSADMGV